MVKYKVIASKNGRKMYYKNGKMVKEADIPSSIINQLEPGTEITIDSSEPVGTPATVAGGTVTALPPETVDDSGKDKGQSQQGSVCIFCGEVATKTKYVNMTTTRLCDKDYKEHTTGEIVAQMREVANKKG